MSAAAQVVQSFGPIHPKEFGDGRGAFLALESKYRREGIYRICLLYTSDAADDTPCVDLGGRRIIKKKK